MRSLIWTSRDGNQQKPAAAPCTAAQASRRWHAHSKANKRHNKHLHNLGELAMRSYWKKISRSIGLTVNYLAGGERNRAGYSAAIQGTRA